ncbi:hypothetical protein CYMTET_41809 [Cymbomonas tetramitiformis]|uniref:AP2/ERF domain-containing protein n=1 Tax=Cymbomonas tetramitiformis TaxID=36881 RepID=A0AAE0C6P5_9CHLO|nr:hypothetical protein CYMTET_41809 [Cymbomonas tetramitiformis]
MLACLQSGGAPRDHRAARTALPAPRSAAVSKQAAARPVVAASKAAAHQHSTKAKAAPRAVRGEGSGRPAPRGSALHHEGGGEAGPGGGSGERRGGQGCRKRARGMQGEAEAGAAKVRRVSSRYRGVCFREKERRWRARINVGGRDKNLGYFAVEESAAEAYDRASRELRGADTTKVNFPLPGQQVTSAQPLVRATAHGTQANHVCASSRKSSYRGVYWHKQNRKWYTRINIGGQIKHLGYFAVEESAAEAYDRASRELRGADTTKVNFPLPSARSEPTGTEVPGGGAPRDHRAARTALPAPRSAAVSKQAAARPVVAASKAAAHQHSTKAKAAPRAVRGEGSGRPAPRGSALHHEGGGEAGPGGGSGERRGGQGCRKRARGMQGEAEAGAAKVRRVSSRYRGVCFREKERRWCARIKIEGQERNLGYFAVEESAAEAYDRASRELRGADTTKVNFPLPSARSEPAGTEVPGGAAPRDHRAARTALSAPRSAAVSKQAAARSTKAKAAPRAVRGEGSRRPAPRGSALRDEGGGEAGPGGGSGERRGGQGCRKRARGMQGEAEAGAAKVRRVSSRYRGVCFREKERRWYARITIEGRDKNLGYFAVEESAAEAYDRASRELRGADTSKVNFPLPSTRSEPSGTEVPGGGAPLVHQAARTDEEEKEKKNLRSLFRVARTEPSHLNQRRRGFLLTFHHR